MQTFRLSLRYLGARPLTTTLNLLLLTLALGSITLVISVSAQVERAFERDLQGIDAVVGAKGSPLQLILSGVFHIDVPTGNIALADVQALRRHPQVAQVMALSLGDSFRGFRLVGAPVDYLAHYDARLAQGVPWGAPMQVVLGAQAALGTGLKPGDHFVGSHGLGGNGPAHAQDPYQVSGVLAPCACVLDRLILTATESVWQVHEAAHALDESDREILEAEREVTVALVRYATPLAAVSFVRWVNGNTSMQAAAPALEITRLLRLVGVGTDVLRALASVLLLSAGVSVFMALWSAVRERCADLAMLRMLGASPAKVAGLLLCEALWLALLASALGLALGHGLIALLGWMLGAESSMALNPWQWQSREVWVPALALGVAVLAAAVPVSSAYRLDVTRLLGRR